MPVLQQFAMLGGLISVLDVAANGTLVYVRGSATPRRPVWVDREGREESIKGPNAQYQYLSPRLSPDGRRLAFHDITGSGEYDVWIQDLERGTVEQTDDGSGPRQRADLVARRAGISRTTRPDSLAGPASSSAAPTGPVMSSDSRRERTLPSYWSADGNWLAYADFGDRGISVATVTGLMGVDVEGDHTPRVLIKGIAGSNRPDRAVGRRIPTRQQGMTRSTCCRFQILHGARSRISIDGGRNPTWAPDGKTLFYRRGQAIMAVAVGGDDPSTWPKPQKLFEGPYLFDIGPTHFDVARDGRFLMVKTAAPDGDDAPHAARRRTELVRGVAPACAGEVKIGPNGRAYGEVSQ